MNQIRHLLSTILSIMLFSSNAIASHGTQGGTGTSEMQYILVGVSVLIIALYVWFKLYK